MKSVRLFWLLLTVTPLAAAPFPGVKAILTPEEITRSGIDRLSPDQIGVIDAALIRYLARSAPAAAPAPRSHAFWDRFGLPDLHSDWRDEPVLKARVTRWVGGNQFQLDTGAVWAGDDPIPIDLVGHEIEIQPRPAGAFALVVDGHNTTLRVHRVR
ncbi:MAG TPA: hypothetical protein VHE61_19475 [Opitutaceae bacterium]|nr:hypothetical protein [Opitutaceae bacterium]